MLVYFYILSILFMSAFISAKLLFTGSEWIKEAAVEIKDGKII